MRLAKISNGDFVSGIACHSISEMFDTRTLYSKIALWWHEFLLVAGRDRKMPMTSFDVEIVTQGNLVFDFQ